MSLSLTPAETLVEQHYSQVKEEIQNKFKALSQGASEAQMNLLRADTFGFKQRAQRLYNLGSVDRLAALTQEVINYAPK